LDEGMDGVSAKKEHVRADEATTEVVSTSWRDGREASAKPRGQTDARLQIAPWSRTFPLDHVSEMGENKCDEVWI
jgi:hypothetical protein